MGRLHEIRLKSDSFIANINDRIDEAIMFAEQQILDLNREQMKERQVDSSDQNLPEYSSYWKSIKGLTYYNLLDTGSFQEKMFMNVNYPNFVISSKDFKTDQLIKKVGNRMFGIAPSNQGKAKQITVKAFAKKYKSFVFG